MDPATGMIIASLIASATAGGMGALSGSQAKKAGERKAKEMKRQTYADLLNSSLQNQAEIQGQGLDTSRKIGSARTRGLLDTASTMRDAFR